MITLHIFITLFNGSYWRANDFMVFPVFLFLFCLFNWIRFPFHAKTKTEFRFHCMALELGFTEGTVFFLLFFYFNHLAVTLYQLLNTFYLFLRFYSGFRLYILHIVYFIESHIQNAKPNQLSKYNRIKRRHAFRAPVNEILFTRLPFMTIFFYAYFHNTRNEHILALSVILILWNILQATHFQNETDFISSLWNKYNSLLRYSKFELRIFEIVLIIFFSMQKV